MDLRKAVCFKFRIGLDIAMLLYMSGRSLNEDTKNWMSVRDFGSSSRTQGFSGLLSWRFSLFRAATMLDRTLDLLATLGPERFCTPLWT